MKIVFDITTPKQVTFFKPMIDNLNDMGTLVYIITRNYTELNILTDSLNLKAKVIGKHGGSSLLGKLTNAAERVLLLAKYFNKVKPDVIVTLSNPESSRAAFGLNIPIVCFNDAPESKFVAKLTLPLASAVCTPWLIPKKDLVKYGVSAEKIQYYHALDPVIWLERVIPDTNYVETLGLTMKRPIVICRETEWQSSYEKLDIVNHVIRKLRNRHPEWQIINIPRYRKHQYYDVPSLLSCADLFIGGGGTMCIEASYYGTPVIATRRLECHYMEWLFKNKLASKADNIDDVAALSENIINNKIRNSSLAKKYYGKMQFPLDEICDVIIKLSQNKKLH